jgi:hypothetical protein
MLYKTKKIIDFIKGNQNSNDNIVLCGYSSRTKKLIHKYKIAKKINYILDNDTDKLNTNYLHIPIIDQKTLENIQNPIIIIWGNYTSAFYNQVKNLNFKSILIEYQKHLTYLQNLSNLFDTNFIFKLETPNFQTLQELNTSHKFIPILINELLKLNIKISTKTVYSNNKGYFEERKVPHNCLYLSYHSVGMPKENLLRYKEGYLPNMITLDKKGYSGWSSLCDENTSKKYKNISKNKASVFFNKLSKKYIQNNNSKYHQPNNVDFEFPKNFIFFPLQTLSDSVMKLSYFKPVILLKKIVKILNEQNIPLVIKQHPKCTNTELSELLFHYEKNKKIILFNGSIHDAISKASTIYTINSGVGFEALLHLKPVITFGKSDYMNVTKNTQNLENIKNEPIYRLSKKDKNNIMKFMYYYINEKCLFLNDTKKLEEIITTFMKDYLKRNGEY